MIIWKRLIMICLHKCAAVGISQYFLIISFMSKRVQEVLFVFCIKGAISSENVTKERSNSYFALFSGEFCEVDSIHK